MVGFDSISIDYARLLDGLRVAKSAGDFVLAYHKPALSVLENVVYARDFEKKWIQSHPMVLYDQMLVQHMIEKVDSAFRGGRPRVINFNANPPELAPSLFSKEALSREGVQNYDGDRVRLVADEDILFLAKNRCFEDELVQEYLNRGSRRHPLWKSEADYRNAFARRNEGEVDALRERMRGIAAWMSEKGHPLVLNDATLEELEREKIDAEKSDTSAMRTLAAAREKYIKLLRAMKDFCDSAVFEDENGVKRTLAFSFALISSDSFKSGFEGEEFSSIRIVFEKGDSTYVQRFRQVAGHITYAGAKDAFYYLYHEDANKPYFSKEKLVEALMGCFQ